MNAMVIDMATRKAIKPKEQVYEHAGQRYRCCFDPNAPPNEQWVWIVEYVQTYRYYGHAPTLEGASKGARLKIHKLNKWEDDQDEHELSNS